MNLALMVESGRELRSDVPRLNTQQIADDIADRIRSGEYPAGSALPSYTQLAELYSVHRSRSRG